VKATTLTVNGDDVLGLLAQREPAFTVATPLMKTVSAGGVSLGINPGATVTAAAFATGDFRILKDTKDLLKFQIMDTGTGGTGRWQNTAVMSWNVTTKGTLQIDRVQANGAAQITIDAPLLVNESVTCGALHADTMTIGSAGTMALTTAAITAMGTSGVLLLTKDGVPGFALEDDAVCRAYSDLHVVGRMTVAESITAGDFELATLANGSLAIQKAVVGNANIPDGTYTAARFDISALFGGSTFTNAVAADSAPYVTHVSKSIFRNDLHVMGNLSCDGVLTPSPFWVAGNIGTNGAVYDHKGRYGFSAVKISGDHAYDIVFPSHPDGNRYTVSTSSS